MRMFLFHIFKNKRPWKSKYVKSLPGYIFIMIFSSIFIFSIKAGLDTSKLTLPDELCYAGIVKRITLYNNYTTPIYFYQSILERGYPTFDAHYPGFCFFTSIFTKIFGFSESKLISFNIILYIVSSLLVLSLAKYFFKEPNILPILSAMGFCINPLITYYSLLFMPELLVVCFWTMLLVLTFRLKDGYLKNLIIGILVVAGFSIRQTIIIYVIPYIIYLIYKKEKALTYSIFTVLITVSLLLFYYMFLHPKILLYPFGVMANAFTYSNSLLHTIKILSENLIHNILRAGIQLNPRNIQHLYLLMIYFFIICIIISYKKSDTHQKILYITFSLQFIIVFALLFIFYDYFDWRHIRIMMFLIPVGTISLVHILAILFREKRLFTIKVVILLCLLGIILYAHQTNVEKHTQIRNNDSENEYLKFLSLTRNINYKICLTDISSWRVALISDKDFIVNIPNSLEEMHRLNNIVKIDLIVTSKIGFSNMIITHFRNSFDLLKNFENVYVFVKKEDRVNP